MEFLALLGPIVIYVAGIAVVIKMFQKEGALKAILGFLCLLYAYIWGWQNTNEESLGLPIKTWMYIWTGAWLLGIVLNMVASGGG